MSMEVDWDAVLALADKRDAWCKAMKPCPGCGTKQVQLCDWVGEEPAWKCRQCSFRWKGL